MLIINTYHSPISCTISSYKWEMQFLWTSHILQIIELMGWEIERYRKKKHIQTYRHTRTHMKLQLKFFQRINREKHHQNVNFLRRCRSRQHPMFSFQITFHSLIPFHHSVYRNVYLWRNPFTTCIIVLFISHPLGCKMISDADNVALIWNSDWFICNVSMNSFKFCLVILLKMRMNFEQFHM